MFNKIVGGIKSLFGGGQPQKQQSQRQTIKSVNQTVVPNISTNQGYGKAVGNTIYVPRGQTLGASTSTNTGGGFSGSATPTQVQQPGAQPTGDQGYYEQAGGEPDTSYIDELLNPALASLDSLENETRSLLGGGERQAEEYRKSAETKATEAKNTGLGQVQAQGVKNANAANEAELQQRRGYSEIAQQFTGRFGRSGFGQGIVGSVAENTLQTVGRIRTGLQETINDLNVRKNQLEDIFNSAVQEATLESENLKQSARAQLQQALGEIGQSRVALQTRRAELVNSALENYRQAVAAVNQRNAAFQQQIYLNKQQADLKIQAAQTRATGILSNMKSFSMSEGETKFLSPQDAEAMGLSGEGELPGGINYGSAGNFGVLTKPKSGSSYDDLKKEAGL